MSGPNEAWQVKEVDAYFALAGLSYTTAVSMGTERRARSETAFDDQGRVYQTKVFSVNQSDGTLSSSALTTNIW